ncbi:hypothetical protein HPB51_010881 [Rhipicephalus microplus]|uniref:Uncharacterized protein n=1 Tax=Rhipicephalus microplus TaxID=6941 RepID=A0A9J6DMA7_RHIMP|nr:hypothetical protein HPB51_010881 [Rhipicephalus microplus]
MVSASSPLLGILVGVFALLVFIGIIIIIVMKVKTGKRKSVSGSNYSDIEMKYVEPHITDRISSYENGSEKKYPESFTPTLSANCYMPKQRAEDLTYAELSLPPSTQSTFSRSLSRSGCRAVVSSPPLTGPHEPPTEYADIDFVATRAHGMPSSPLAPSSPSPPSHGGGGGASRAGTEVWVPPRSAFDSWPKYTIKRPGSPNPRLASEEQAFSASHSRQPPSASSSTLRSASCL